MKKPSKKEISFLYKMANTITPPNWNAVIWSGKIFLGKPIKIRGYLNILIDLITETDDELWDFLDPLNPDEHDDNIAQVKNLFVNNGAGEIQMHIFYSRHLVISDFEGIKDTLIHELAHVAEYQFEAYKTKLYRDEVGGTLFPNARRLPDGSFDIYDRAMHGEEFERAQILLKKRAEKFGYK